MAYAALSVHKKHGGHKMTISSPKLAMKVFTFLAIAIAGVCVHAQYTPDWPSIDSRPLPAWYDEAKIGIFIHWGVYAVPAAADEWIWHYLKSWPDGDPYALEYMAKYQKPGFTYQEFAPQFTAEFFRPDDWARLFERAGARYVVLTSKHHDGYTLWPSSYSYSWNAMDVGPHRDLVGELASAIRNVMEGRLKFGLYHSLFEWYNPRYLADAANNYSTSDYVVQKMMPELRHIVETYNPEILWSDGEWEAPSSYWKATEFLAWLYNNASVKETVLTNDRWGSDTRNVHGGFKSGEDRQNPGVLLPYKWENAFTLDRHSWGYRGVASLDQYMSIEQVLQTLIMTVSCGGNALINVGPSKDGMIPLLQQEQLAQLGEWLSVNGDAIYGSVPHTVQNDTLNGAVWYTKNSGRNQVYAMFVGWPKPGRTLRLGSMSVFDFSSIELLGNPGLKLEFVAQDPGILVTLPHLEDVASKWGWTLVFFGRTSEILPNQ